MLYRRIQKVTLLLRFWLHWHSTSLSQLMLDAFTYNFFSIWSLRYFVIHLDVFFSSLPFFFCGDCDLLYYMRIFIYNFIYELHFLVCYRNIQQVLFYFFYSTWCSFNLFQDFNLRKNKSKNSKEGKIKKEDVKDFRFWKKKRTKLV